MGIIADIAYDPGELDEALRIRREIELPVYERLAARRHRRTVRKPRFTSCSRLVRRLPAV